MTPEFRFAFPPLPDGYDQDTKIALGPRNTIIVAHHNMPVLYFDESTMQWRVLEVHVSEVAKCES